jgi:hypothetical protein
MTVDGTNFSTEFIKFEGEDLLHHGMDGYIPATSPNLRL